MKECRYKNHIGERLLPLTEFRKRAASKDGLTSQCKVCLDRLSEDWRSRNNSRKIELQKQRQQKLSKQWKEYKASVGCKCCGEQEPICLELHHLDPLEKEETLSNMVARGYSWENLLKEAEKGIIVCANCHRKIHADIIKI